MGMKNERVGWDSAASNGPKRLFVALISLCLYVLCLYDRVGKKPA